ncbi:hypothetical protein UWK_02149 [Desulfocapsa sulfexigens DSM 10523]|uniref:Uncharacterized protein n=1 Tax=Desulfocapsa sulfexigens (strain DSM 10523 / SB164P1) TaxID=1167006 RepID=M1PAL2_DESSD|nr:hypothetical protein UWK_02149 [Desulfocapsa sulfexigens DSM 10523]
MFLLYHTTTTKVKGRLDPFHYSILLFAHLLYPFEIQSSIIDRVICVKKQPFHSLFMSDFIEFYELIRQGYRNY